MLLVDPGSPLTTNGGGILLGMTDDCLGTYENATKYPDLFRLFQRWADDCLDAD